MDWASSTPSKQVNFQVGGGMSSLALSGGRVFVVGVGMTNFLKPSKDNPEYYKMAAEAGRRALADAGIGYGDLDQVYLPHCIGLMHQPLSLPPSLTHSLTPSLTHSLTPSLTSGRLLFHLCAPLHPHPYDHPHSHVVLSMSKSPLAQVPTQASARAIRCLARTQKVDCGLPIRWLPVTALGIRLAASAARTRLA